MDKKDSTNFALLSKLAKMHLEPDDEFSVSQHFATEEPNNTLIAQAVKRKLEEREKVVADEAANAIIEELGKAEATINDHRRALAEIRRSEARELNHIRTLAVARAYATKTGNYVPLYWANKGQWESVDIPAKESDEIWKEIVAARGKPGARSKNSRDATKLHRQT